VGRASMAGSITLVMVFYHFMLAPNYQFEGGLLVSNILMHYIAPLLYLVWWAVFSSHGTLRLRNVPVMLLPGILYVVYSLVRGAIVGEYPYDIIDVDQGRLRRRRHWRGILIVHSWRSSASSMVGIDRLIARLLGPPDCRTVAPARLPARQPARVCRCSRARSSPDSSSDSRCILQFSPSPSRLRLGNGDNLLNALVFFSPSSPSSPT
jgi:hypothetical protein